MKNMVPKHVLTNRRRKISEFAKEYNLTPEILAEFFQVPIKVINNDLQTGETDQKPITIVKEGLKVFCIYQQKIELVNSVQEKVKDRNINRRDWAYEGFWMEPKHFGDDCRDMFLNVTNLHRRRLMQKACSMYRFGYTIADVRLVCKLTRMEVELVKKAGNENRKNTFQKWALTQFKKGSSFASAEVVAAAVGVSAQKLIKGDKYYYDVLKKQGKRPSGLKEPKRSNAKRYELKSEVYLKWKSGDMTQEELAKEYGVKDRVTIGNWIREMKARETDDIYSLGWRRNTSNAGRANIDAKKTARRELCLNKIKSLIEEGASLNHMSKVSGNCAETIKRYMKDVGLWEDYLKKRPELTR